MGRLPQTHIHEWLSNGSRVMRSLFIQHVVPQFHSLVYLRLLRNRGPTFRHYKNPYKHGMKGLAPTRGVGKGPTGPSLAPPTCPGYARLRAFSIRLSGSVLLTVVPHQKARSRAPPGYRPARHVGGTGFGKAPVARLRETTGGDRFAQNRGEARRIQRPYFKTGCWLSPARQDGKSASASAAPKLGAQSASHGSGEMLQ